MSLYFALTEDSIFMSADVTYMETTNYRLIEYLQSKQSDLYLKICGIEQRLPGKVFGPEIREGYHLHAVLSGKGRLRIGEQEYEVHAGQLFLTVPGLETWYQADLKEPWLYCWATYDGRNAGEYLENAGFKEGVYVLDCEIDVNSFLEVARELISKSELNFSSELKRTGLAYEFLALAVESYESENQKSGIYKDFSMDDYIDYAVKYIHANYANLQINNVAKYIGVNRTYFTALFKKKMYISPQEYLMNIRMEQSRELLEKTDLPINTIAASVGYDNALTFSKIFKQKHGVSPKNYRKQRDDAKGEEG